MTFPRPWLNAILTGMLAVSVAAAQHGGQARGGAQGTPAQRSELQQPQANPAQREASPRPQVQAGGKAENNSGEQIFMRMMRMSPEEREKALSQLPSSRRTQIEDRIRNFQSLPPETQMRQLDRLERLNSLPSREQNQVRRSMRQLQQLPDDRRTAVRQEIGRLAPLTQDERWAIMDSEEFRGRFSSAERQIITNMVKIE